MAKKIFLALLILGFLFAGCKEKKTKTYDLKKRSTKTLLKHLKQNEIQATWFSSKASIDFNGNNQSVSLTSNIRMKKDSIIWMNIKKFGFEVGRAMITEDSVFVLSRLTQQYLAKDLNYLKNNFNVSLTFSQLQALLLGNPIYFSDKYKSNIKGNEYRLVTSNSDYQVEYFLDGLSYLLTTMIIRDKKEIRDVSVDQSDYKLLANGKSFSYFRRLDFFTSSSGSITIELDFSKIEIDVPKKTPFSVPDDYERIN